MMSASIIKFHREYLVRRLVSRNSLLRFKPTKTNRQLDICDIFPEPGLLQDEDKNDICKSPDEFLQRIFREESVKSNIVQGAGIPTQLNKLKNTAKDNKRTVGQWTLVLAWPFLHVPANMKGRTNPLFAPLFLWRIKISDVQNGSANFSLVRDDEKSECELNFILDEYLKAKMPEIRLPNEEEILATMQEGAAASDKAEAIKAWLGENNKNIENINNLTGNIQSYSNLPLPDQPALIPVAVLGNAHFNYLSLFRDLETLEKKAGGNEDLGLLSSLVKDISNVEPTDIPTPDESNQWLVEESDPTQETAVWQSGRDNAPIIRLEGPPGTGKSQTIVNIVANALRQKKKIAVVCHHTAALDVVRKRLDSAGLGELVAQITSPKENRSAIIRKARDLDFPDTGNPEHARDAVCAAIENNEEICNARRNSFSPTPYFADKTRGHFLAKIDAVKRNRGFDANLPLNKTFIQTIERWLESNPKEQALLDKVKDIAEKWRTHDYPNHLWAGISTGWENEQVPELQSCFDHIIEKIASLHSQDLPSEVLLPFVTHPLVNRYYSQITKVTRRDTLASLSEIVKTTRYAFNLANLQPCPPLWELLHQQEEAMAIYSKYKNTIMDIPDIVSIKSAIKNNNVIHALAHTYPEKPEHWREIVEASICRAGWSNLPPGPAIGKYNQAKNRLADAITSKKEANVEQLIQTHAQRQGIRDELRQNGYLQLKKGKKPATTLRKLYHYETEAGKSIWEVFPVLLTNPGSVSEIMPLDLGSIDLLIIDEASQLFTADAMPLLYRSKHAVISGDEHQMPPSNFFALIDDDDMDDDDEQREVSLDLPYELLEAITQCTNAAYSLGVHYRSRSAELIAFSNHAFYKGKLQAAPYNKSSLKFRGGRAISVERVGGSFDNGTNAAEVAFIIKVLQEIREVHPDYSVGIIVFNVKQRDLIEYELAKKSDDDENFREIHNHFLGLKQDGDDVGLFVRSVEHVQGDERDIIILGTTYGNENRHYGPLSTKELGRRRLNVAVTRAKSCMVVITSLNINSIPNEGERPDGGDAQTGKERWYLWKYLQYAQAVSDGNELQAGEILRNINPIATATLNGEGPANNFERQVGEFLQAQGLHVDYQVGQSGFSIDIGVKHNIDDPTYLCGVECDGRTYHSGWRARENDIWRQKILEDKGWRIERIWSDQWFSGSDAVWSRFIAQVRNNVTADQ